MPSRRNKLILEGLLKSIDTIEKNKINLTQYSGEKEKADKMLHERNLFLSEVLDGILPAKAGLKKVTKSEVDSSEVNNDFEDLFSENELTGNLLDQENLSDSSAVDSAVIVEDTLKQKMEEKPKPEVPVVKKINKNQKTARELIQELIKHKYLVAEYYYLDLGQPDSAKIIFEDFLSEYKNSEFAPKAALSLGLLNESVYKDSSAADSFYNIVVTEYPKSPSVIEANRRLKRSSSDNASIVNPAGELYEKAYYEGFSNKNLNAAYAITFKIQSEYPATDIAAKAAFLMASIVDEANLSPDSSISEYKRVIKLYPKTVYAKKAKLKVKQIYLVTEAKDNSEDRKGKGKKGKKGLIK